MSLTFIVDDNCPRCSKPTRFAVIKRHPTRDDVAIRSLQCPACGLVKTRDLSLRLGDPVELRVEVVSDRNPALVPVLPSEQGAGWPTATQVAKYAAKAAKMEQRAKEATNPIVAEEYLRLAYNWRHLEAKTKVENDPTP